jgi:hypothetical protein
MISPGVVIVKEPRRNLPRRVPYISILATAARALLGRLSIDDFELNPALGPHSYGAKDDAERLSGMALLAYNATQVFFCHPQLKY